MNTNDSSPQIENPSNNKYFTMVPHIVADILKNPYQFRLMFHYLRVCGPRGVCWESNATTAEKCGMSQRKMIATRQELADLGLITIQHRKGQSILISIVDMMPENVRIYADGGLHHMQGGVAPHARGGLHHMQPKNNQYKKNHLRKDSCVDASNDTSITGEKAGEVLPVTDEQAQQPDTINLPHIPGLTFHQLKVLREWLTAVNGLEVDYYTGEGFTTRTMNILVKKGVLSQNERGEYSTQYTVPGNGKSVTFGLTNKDLAITANYKGDPVLPQGKPFWEAFASAICWNDYGRKWQDVIQTATPSTLAKLNKQIKNLCVILDKHHAEKPVHPHELQSFFVTWHINHRTDKEADGRFHFPTTVEGFDTNFSKWRAEYALRQLEKEGKTQS